MTPAVHSRGRHELGFADLLLPFDRTCSLLLEEVEARRWVDAYLLASAASQILDDHLHADPASLRRAAEFLGDRRGVARIVARAARLAATTIVSATDRRSETRRLVAYRDRLASLTVTLADLVLTPPDVADPVAAQLAVTADALAREADKCPSTLRNALLRLPSSFRSFDQRPQDVVELIARLAKRVPDTARPIAVVGLRTSGSYLGPLATAALARQGYTDLHYLSVRPGSFLRADERRTLAAVAGRGGLVVLVDDPPSTGSSLVAAAAHVERCGVDRSSIVIAACLFGDEWAVPKRLAGFATVTLGWDDWHFHTMFERPVVMEVVRTLLPDDTELVDLETLPTPNGDRDREHCQRSFTMHLRDRTSGCQSRQTLIVEGSGLGLFGRHAVAVAAALPDHTPAVLGFRDGLLYMVLDEAVSIQSTYNADMANSIAGYVARRERSLPASRDRSIGLSGRQPVWEVAANELCKTFGRAGIGLRIPLVDPIVRRITRVARPSIIDGRMDPERWLTTGEGTSLVKLEFAEGAFSHRDLYCYDAVFDLASAAISAGAEASSAAMRSAYERASGSVVDDERWLIYSLVHLWDKRRLRAPGVDDHSRAMAQAVQHYFSSRYLGDIVTDPVGQFVAVDIDGVLESDTLGYPATTESGALALRALKAHGYRSLIASGRSIDEVGDRCHSYGLAGGVAEYGTVVYDATTRRVVDLSSDEDRDTLERVRAELLRLPGIELDPNYRHSVRAFRNGSRGRRGLDPETVDAVVAAIAPARRITPIPGMGQTDFVPSAHTKANGLIALIELLGSTSQPGRRPLALAVGDGVADIPMFALAELAVAPANAADVVRASTACRVVRGSYQLGLAQAVQQLIGHRPGKCPTCALGPLRPEARMLVDLLSVQEAGMRGMPARALRLARRSVVARW
jgi:hydroxymethylpyrimidine pyrophosphatase-like HAD family hydrolase